MTPDLFIILFATAILAFTLCSIYLLKLKDKEALEAQALFHEHNLKKALEFIIDQPKGHSTNILINKFGCKIVSDLLHTGVITISDMPAFVSLCGKKDASTDF